MSNMNNGLEEVTKAPLTPIRWTPAAFTICALRCACSLVLPLHLLHPLTSALRALRSNFAAWSECCPVCCVSGHVGDGLPRLASAIVWGQEERR